MVTDDGSGKQCNGLDLSEQIEAGADFKAFGRAPGDAGEQGMARYVELYQHVAGCIGCAEFNNAGVNAVQNAAVYLWHQRQADVTSMDATAQRRAQRLTDARNVNCATAKLEPRQIIGFVFGDPPIIH